MYIVTLIVQHVFDITYTISSFPFLVVCIITAFFCAYDVFYMFIINYVLFLFMDK